MSVYYGIFVIGIVSILIGALIEIVGMRTKTTGVVYFALALMALGLLVALFGGIMIRLPK